MTIDPTHDKNGALSPVYSDASSATGGQGWGLLTSPNLFDGSDNFLSPPDRWTVTGGAYYLETFGNVLAAPEFAGGGSSASHGGGGGGGGNPPPPTTLSNNYGLAFNINWDSSVGSAPTGFVGAFEQAIGYFLGNFGSPQPITIGLSVGWGEAGGQRLPVGALGESLTNIEKVDYSLLQTKMSAYLPSTGDPITVANHSYWVASAEEKALGIPTTSTLDGAVGFSSRVTWDFTGGSTTPKGQYDFVSVSEHEISETMGRIALLGTSVSDNGVIYPEAFSPLDLFRYSQPGVRSLVGGQTAYFSPDGSTSSPTTYFNSTAGGDWGDWQSSGVNSAGNDA